jgi:hypothetical protein
VILAARLKLWEIHTQRYYHIHRVVRIFIQTPGTFNRIIKIPGIKPVETRSKSGIKWTYLSKILYASPSGEGIRGFTCASSTGISTDDAICGQAICAARR